jgi:ribosomal protein L12E/L44/L45/RPP1/RPP2
MTITINLPPATINQLKAEAQATGKDVETVVREAVEAKMSLSHVSLQEVIRPINEAIATSAMSAEEAEAFFEQELSAMRAERKSSQASNDTGRLRLRGAAASGGESIRSRRSVPCVRRE